MSYSKQEILKAFNNQPEDVVPVSFWHHFAKSEFINALDHPEVVDINVNGHKKYVKAVKPDFVKSMSDGYFVTPSLNGFGEKTIEDLQQIQPINVDDPWITQQQTLATKQKEAVGDRPIFYTVFSPITTLKWSLFDHDKEPLATGDKRFAELYLQNPEALKQALKKVALDIKKLVHAVLQTDIDGIYYSTQSIQDSRVKTIEFFHDVIEPIDLDVIAEINRGSQLNILHVCGFDGATNDLNWFKDYPLQVINWATHVDGLSLADGKKLFGNKPVLGGFGDTDKDLLYNGSKEEIQAEVKRLIAEAGTTGVIIGADCTIPRDTPEDHIRWAEEAVHQVAIK